MKKTLLALATTSALVVSGSAFAAFADAPKNEGSAANAQLEITGTLTNTNPNWMWEIPVATKTAVANKGMKLISGVVNGANTEFKITNTPLSILEGYMKTPTPTPGSGLSPVIVVNGKNMENCISTSACSISIPAEKAGASVGNVALDLVISGSYFYNSPTISYEMDWDSPSWSSRAVALLKLQSDYLTTYGDLSRGVLANTMQEQDNFLSSSSVQTNISASRVLTLNSSKLVVPSDSIPNSWAASLPVTISLK